MAQRRALLYDLVAAAEVVITNANVSRPASMDQRSRPSHGHPVPLSVTAGGRLVMPDGEPVPGWIGTENGRDAGPLVFPAGLLEPKAAEKVFYAANLPRTIGKAVAGTQRVKTARKIRPGQESAFLATSLPGGQVSAILRDGVPAAVRFRWQALEPLSWQCFASLRGQKLDEAWMLLPGEYSFGSSGVLESQPASQILSAGTHELQIIHPEGRLTCLPCSSGLVKVTRLDTDGWSSRELTRLKLLPDRSIEAQFSDRRSMVFAVAAPSRAASGLTA